MGCVLASKSSSKYTASTSSSSFGSNYSKKQLILDDRTNIWEFSEKHQNTLMDFSNKSNLNVPTEVINIIQSYLLTEKLIILSRGNVTVPYSTDIKKICVMGSTGVGKSAMVIQFVSGKFVEEWDPTIDDSYRKEIIVNNDTSNKMTLEIIDTTGELEFNPIMFDIWIRESNGFIIAYDLTNIESYKAINEYLETIERNKYDYDPNFACVIVGCKGDLILNGKKNRCVSENEVIEFCKERNLPYVECSAKDNINIEILMKEIIIIESYKEIKYS